MCSSDCEGHIHRTENLGYTQATIHDGMGQALVSHVRNSQRVMHDDPDLAAHLWQCLQPYVPVEMDGWQAIGLNERFRYYKYDKYQSFKWHRDMPYRRNATEMSKLTFMVYLNDGFEGGVTDFKDFKVWPETGMAVCFNHKLTHEGAPISCGTKYVLRTDVMYRYTGM